MPYTVEMRDNKTGEVRMVPIEGGWNAKGSMEAWRLRMCDCNCHGFYHRQIMRDEHNREFPEPHPQRAHTFGPCEHGGKRSRYTPIKAILPDGTEVQL